MALMDREGYADCADAADEERRSDGSDLIGAGETEQLRARDQDASTDSAYADRALSNHVIDGSNAQGKLVRRLDPRVQEPRQWRIWGHGRSFQSGLWQGFCSVDF